MTEEQVFEKGLKLLFDELGPVDAIRFIHECQDICKGDYTKERYDLEFEDLKKIKTLQDDK